MTTWITVCDTCKREDDGIAGADVGIIPSGARLADLVERAAAAEPAVAVRRFSCLMGCSRACNVTVQSAGKTGYTLAGFTPDPGVADALARWAALHAASDSGRVPYRQWPDAVKGHFVSRHPLVPEAP